MSPGVQRKLTTILAADAEGYSRAMDADEVRALGALHAARSVFAKFIERHHGRIVNTAGDHAATGNGNGDENGDSQFAAESLPTHIDGAPVVDVTIRIQEGEQYFVNRINIVGNRTTHDQVIRRELQLYERGVFNTAGLQHSVRRLNQLGFFEPLEESEVGIEKTEGAEENEVDLTFNLTEANLNQLTFGAGVSQFDGFFGQISFQTSNFLGRGETLGIGIQSGSRVRDINLTFTEPYLFDRNMSGQIGLFSRRIEWLGARAALALSTASSSLPRGRRFRPRDWGCWQRSVLRSLPSSRGPPLRCLRPAMS